MNALDYYEKKKKSIYAEREAYKEKQRLDMLKRYGELDKELSAFFGQLVGDYTGILIEVNSEKKNLRVLIRDQYEKIVSENIYKVEWTYTSHPNPESPSIFAVKIINRSGGRQETSGGRCGQKIDIEKKHIESRRNEIIYNLVRWGKNEVHPDDDLPF